MFNQLMQIHCVVTFKNLRKVDRAGECQKLNHHVSLDPTSRYSLAKVFLHELIHLLHKDWSERRVLWWETHLWKSLTPEQVEALYHKMRQDKWRAR